METQGCFSACDDFCPPWGRIQTLQTPQAFPIFFCSSSSKTRLHALPPRWAGPLGRGVRLGPPTGSTGHGTTKGRSTSSVCGAAPGRGQELPGGTRPSTEAPAWAPLELPARVVCALI